MTPHMETVFIDGIECLVAEPSEHNTPADIETIVCLHGIGGDDQSFLPQLNSLSRQYRVVAWNMPGYKQSTPLTNMTFPALAQGLASVAEHCSHGKVHVLGQSIGGMIAQEFALTNSQQVSTLILVATTSAFGGRDDSFKTEFLKARLAPLSRGDSMASVAEKAIPAICGSAASDDAVASGIASMSGVSEESYRQVLSCLVTFNRRTEFADITCPVCLIAGEEDNNSPARTMQKMAEQLKQSEFHAIAGAGHLVNLEQPDIFNTIVSAFLNKVSG